jgi:hypothetical protein
VERGETLEHVATVYGCTTEAVLRANRLHTTLVRPGTVVVIPACTKARPRGTAAVDPHESGPSSDDDQRARRALAVIDGATVISRREPPPLPPPTIERPIHDGPSASEGQPWNGRLHNGEALPRGDGYRIRRPQRAFGATHVVEHLQRVIAEVRALYPHVHTLAIGDLSAEHGGTLAGHVSHQSGLDVDIGFYYARVPADYPNQFVTADGDLDLEATWALITAFARTTQLDTGVQLILLDYDIQAQLYKWARKRGTPDDQLAQILQYPRGKDVIIGIVRHWPHHADHLHVRFKPAP